MSRHVMEYAPLIDDPPAMPRSSRMWYPKPGFIIPTSGRSSALGEGHCVTPHTTEKLPNLLPRFGSGVSPLDAPTIEALNTIQLGFGNTERVIVAAIYKVVISPSFTVTNYDHTPSGAAIYAGSTGFDIPPIPAHGVIVHVHGEGSTNMMEVNTNFYVTAGPHSTNLFLHVGGHDDRAYPFTGLADGSGAGVSPGFVTETGGWTSVGTLLRGSTSDPMTVEDYVVNDPGWLPPVAYGGYVGFMGVSSTLVGFAEKLTGSTSGTFTITMTYYNTDAPPLGFVGTDGFVPPPSSGSASDRGGCC